MTANVTGRLVLVASLIGVFGLSAGTAFGQAEPLGDEFIFFVNGSNLVVPSPWTTTAADPDDASNTVAQFDYAGWAANGWRWDAATGVDMSANTDDTLYVRIRSSAANAGLRTDGTFRLAFFDSIDESAPDEADQNHEMRLVWTIPQWVHDETWHDLAIPLPPTTRAELDSARVDKNVDGTPITTPLDSLARYWAYGGAWSNSGGGFGICLAPDPLNPKAIPTAPCEDPLFEEFSWDAVAFVGVHFDNNTGGGPIWLDDLYIGGPNTDVSSAADPGAPVASASASPDGAVNVVTWTPTGDASAYNVYFSDEPITSLSKVGGGMALGATVPATTEPLEVRHALEVPHPSFTTSEIYYAVTSLSGFGVENQDVSNSGTSVVNPDLEVQEMIPVLTEDEANAIFDDISAGNVTDASFPAASSTFEINADNWFTGDTGTDFVSNDDLSLAARFGVGPDVGGGAEMYLYAEVTDDANGFLSESTPGGDGWQYDSIQINWGSYEVPWIDGSTHPTMERGVEPDYQWTITVASDDPASGSISQTMPQGNGTVFSNGVDSPVEGALLIADNLDNGAGTVGYKILAYFPFASLINQSQTPPLDALFTEPADDAFKIIPFAVSVNDNDDPGSSTRSDQWGWSQSGWNTPTSWVPVAVAGRSSFGVAVEEVGGEVPAEFTLDQNYPNPFNPTTTINFSLPSSEKVSLTVFDVLGREVQTLIDGQTMAAGKYAVSFDGANGLASGVYVYRLDAGKAFSRTMT
ncbi:MAG: T9SS type A sorting domain-containing protein, partial [Rhodothermia bacterium]|nr:T9SS type A sorting domain-containing protein [Rhodothermia bacterium]